MFVTLKGLTNPKLLKSFGRLDCDQLGDAIDLWLTELCADHKHALGDKVVGDLDFEELFAVLVNCQRHLKEKAAESGVSAAQRTFAKLLEKADPSLKKS